MLCVMLLCGPLRYLVIPAECGQTYRKEETAESVYQSTWHNTKHNEVVQKYEHV